MDFHTRVFSAGYAFARVFCTRLQSFLGWLRICSIKPGKIRVCTYLASRTLGNALLGVTRVSRILENTLLDVAGASKNLENSPLGDTWASRNLENTLLGDTGASRTLTKARFYATGTSRILENTDMFQPWPRNLRKCRLFRYWVRKHRSKKRFGFAGLYFKRPFKKTVRFLCTLCPLALFSLLCACICTGSH